MTSRTDTKPQRAASCPRTHCSQAVGGGRPPLFQQSPQPGSRFLIKGFPALSQFVRRMSVVPELSAVRTVMKDSGTSKCSSSVLEIQRPVFMSLPFMIILFPRNCKLCRHHHLIGQEENIQMMLGTFLLREVFSTRCVSERGALAVRRTLTAHRKQLENDASDCKKLSPSDWGLTDFSLRIIPPL